MQKVAIITGGSRGIGRAISKALVADGYRVGIIYRADHESANSLLKELNASGFNAIALPCDVRDFSALQGAIAKITEVFGDCSLLVNNAGVAHIGLLIDMSVSEWNTVLDTNLNALFYASKLAIPSMLRLGYGNIINIASVWGVYGASCEVAYSSAKAGVIGFTQALAQELGMSGIRVNAISPGVIDTDMNKELTQDDIGTLRINTPLGVIGAPEDIANCCVFLASEKAKFITGQNINVNGGFKG